MTTQLDRRQFVQKLGLYVGLMVGFSAMILAVPWGLKPLPAALLGAMFAHGVELAHELIHQKHFDGNWQRGLGWLLGLPMLVEFSRYTVTHSHHHRRVGTAEDQESFGYDFEQLNQPLGFALHLSMLRHYQTALQNIGWALSGQSSQLQQELGQAGKTLPAKALGRIVHGYCGFGVALLAVVGLSLGLQTTVGLQLWLLPLIFAGPIHALVELPEHWGCTLNTPDCLHNTRTIVPSPFTQWFTNGNCWHVEHHHNPGVPIGQLGALHPQLHPQIRFLNQGYSSFYREFWQSLWRTEPSVSVDKAQ
jgi:fatty acid desaturase